MRLIHGSRVLEYSVSTCMHCNDIIHMVDLGEKMLNYSDRLGCFGLSGAASSYIRTPDQPSS
jgi:hypothetical protein